MIGNLDVWLEAALEEWTQAARDDFRPQIPSSDVLRNTMTTGIYILASIDATLDHTDRQPAARSEATAGVHTFAPQRPTSTPQPGNAAPRH